MAYKVIMPKLGLTMTEGLVAKWYKKEGDPVKAGDVLFEVETDKLTNEVEADCDGVLIRVLAQEGDSVPCKDTVAYIGQAGEVIDEGEASSNEAPAAKADAAQAATLSAPPAQAASAATGGYVLATPAAKALAKEKGVMLSLIPASGPQGSVVLKDVEGYEARPASISGLAAKIAAELGLDVAALSANGRIMSEDVLREALTGAWSDGSGAPAGDTQEPLSGMRKTIARRMSESWLTSPRVNFEMAVDCTNMIALRKQLKNSFEAKGLKLSYNHIIMRAAAQALKEYPAVNASLVDDTLVKHGDINIGLAVSVGGGLLVPNLKGCQRMGLEGIAMGTEDLVKRARDNKLNLEELDGGTFTISNLGMYGMRSFSPIINQPQLAILGVNAMVETPVAVEGEIVIRPIMNLNLVADHRVVDGVLAAQFLQRIVELLETPVKMLA